MHTGTKFADKSRATRLLSRYGPWSCLLPFLSTTAMSTRAVRGRMQHPEHLLLPVLRKKLHDLDRRLNFIKASYAFLVRTSNHVIELSWQRFRLSWRRFSGRMW